jgi:penicillin-binding protein 1A
MSGFMSDPNDDFTAGERLARTSREEGRARLPPQPPSTPPPTPPRAPRPPRRRGPFGFLARFLVFGLYRLVFLGIVGILLVGIVAFLVISASLPSVDSLKTYKPPLETRVYADNFQLVSELADQHRIYVPYDQIPPLVAQAFISTEDRLFWVNPGINPASMVRAGLFDLMHMGSGQRPIGASTITQQVVKNMILDNHITFVSKIKEAMLAMRVNNVMTKKQVLTLYLNEVDLGNNSYGIAAAAQTYFDRPLSHLDIAQAASLAALPKGPTEFNPFLHPQKALARRNFVIAAMRSDGAISQAQAATATAEPLLPRSGGAPLTVPNAGYFADAVRSQLASQFGADQVAQGGLIVHTSLNPVLQQAATDAVRDGLQTYDRAHDGYHGPVAHVDDPDLAAHWTKDLAHQSTPPGMRADWQLGMVLTAGGPSARIGTIDRATGGPVTGTLALADMRWARPAGPDGLGPRPATVADVLHAGDIIMVAPAGAGTGAGLALALEQVPQIQAALISMDARTGRVIAMVGGWSHDVSPFNRAMQAQRQPGSSVKPFVYLTAMEQNIQPDATVLDAPFVVQMADGTVYRPGNYEEDFQGPVPMFHALEQSLNLATLHLARQIGLPAIAKTFQDFGIVDTMPLYYPSAIGAIETTLFRLATAYAELDDGGVKVTPTLIDSVTNPDGSVLFQAANQNCDNCINGDPDQPPQLAAMGQPLTDPDSDFQIVTMMRGVVLRGTGTNAVIGISQPVAGKTGTTNNFNDAWFMGFTPGIVTGCWIGFDNPKSLGEGETGAAACAPIWNQFMRVALKGQPAIDFPVPSGITLAQVAEPSGQSVTEAFKTGQAPGAAGNNMIAQSPGTPGAAAPGTTAPGGATPAAGGSTLPPLY